MPTVNLDSTSYHPGNLILARFLVMFMPFDFAQESVRQAHHECNQFFEVSRWSLYSNRPNSQLMFIHYP